MSTSADLSRLRLGTAPDSWGVWFDHDVRQPPWQRFLDEAAEAGYRWVELGPYGYLPTDAELLRRELDARGLRLSGGTVSAGLHRRGGLEECLPQVREVAQNLRALGAPYVVLLPEMYRGALGREQARELDSDQWRQLARDVDRLGRLVAEDYGLALVVHPHADTHIDTQPRVERLLETTDPRWTNLCLDSGHITYCGGDNIALVQRHPQRLRYVHLKQVDPAVLAEVRAQDRPFAEAVACGVMTEPPHGTPALPPLLAELAALDVDLFAIVEQDMYPCDPATPLPVARRTRDYLASCGLGDPISRGARRAARHASA